MFFPPNHEGTLEYIPQTKDWFTPKLETGIMLCCFFFSKMDDLHVATCSFQWGMTMTSPKIEEQKTPAARVERPWATRRYCVAWPGLPSATLVRWWISLIGGWSVYFQVVLKWQFLSNCGANHHPANREINPWFVFGSVGTTSFPGEVVKYNLKTDQNELLSHQSCIPYRVSTTCWGDSVISPSCCDYEIHMWPLQNVTNSH